MILAAPTHKKKKNQKSSHGKNLLGIRITKIAGDRAESLSPERLTGERAASRDVLGSAEPAWELSEPQPYLV